MNDIEQRNIEEWVDDAPDATQKAFRQAVHTILHAISSSKTLKSSMILKGGILLAIRYSSERFTKDIDFSTSEKFGETLDTESIRVEFDNSLAQTVEELNYALDCRVQGAKKQPKLEDATFPSIKMTIGYAYQGSSEHKKLLSNQSPHTVSIDYSFNEKMPNIEIIQINDNENVQAYSFIDLIAEKLRSLLQQESRNRGRRQDIFDIYILLEKITPTDDEKFEILISLVNKSRSRSIEPEKESFDSEQLKSKASQEYETLADEIVGDLPEFELAFSVVKEFYISLPWELKDEI